MNSSTIDLPPFKILQEDLEVEYDFSLNAGEPAANESTTEPDSIESGLRRVEQEIEASQARIDALNQDIDRLTNHADGIDNLVAVGSGVLAGLIDILWVGDFDFDRGKAWSNRTVNEFVMDVAKKNGFEGDRLDKAIEFLENKFRSPSDNVWHGKDLGISAKSHHLDDLAHHPTPLGLFFSILTQFTKTAYFQNSAGTFLSIGLDESGTELIGTDIRSKFFCGTVNWFFHLVSDMSGSKKTAGAGMGIPGPIVSMLKELSTIPGLDKTGLPQKLNEIFVKEKFDLRGEMAVGYELGRQAVPVMINEVLVRAFYFIRRVVSEWKAKRSLGAIEWRKTLPWNNRTMTRMLTIATGTFTAVDLADAAIRAALRSAGNPAGFWTQLALRVNFVGIGRFAIAIYSDVSMGAERARGRDERIAAMSRHLELAHVKIAYLQADMWRAAAATEASLRETEQVMAVAAELHVRATAANDASLRRIGQMRAGIQERNPQLIGDIQHLLSLG